MLETPQRQDILRAGTGLAALIEGAGSIVPSWPVRGDIDRHAAATGSDIIHLMVQVHGRPDAIVERAAGQAEAAGLGPFFRIAERAFGEERLLLLALVGKLGPQPNTPQHDAANTAIIGHIRAIEMLTCSERAGCALGAALAFLGDWWRVRPLIDAIATRAAMLPPDCCLPGRDEMAAAEVTVLNDPARVRGFWFGAEQLLLQQRGFWDLVAARARARAAVAE